MNLKTLALASLGLALPMGAFGQATNSTSPKITIVSTGADVRYVLRQVFEQAGKAYVLQLDRRDTIELSLTNRSLDEVLQVICTTSGLNIDVKDGIYYVKRAGAPTKPVEAKKPDGTKPTEMVSKIKTEATGGTTVSAKPSTTHEPANFGKDTRIHFLNVRDASKPPVSQVPPKTTKVAVNSAPVEFKPLETPTVLPVSVLQKKVSARMSKTEIRKVFANFTKQTGVNIEIAATVPDYRVDTYLLKTSLKYAMDRITEAAGLEYKFTNRNSILVNKPKRATVAIKSN